MAPQTVYKTGPDVGYAGMLADASDHYTRSFKATVEIPLGLAVSRAGADDQCKLPTTSAEAQACIGFSTHSHTYETPPTNDTNWPVGSVVPVTKIGVIWVPVETAVVAGDPVYVRYGTSGSNTQQGAVRNTTDTNAALLGSAQFISSAAAGGLAQVHVNLP